MKFFNNANINNFVHYGKKLDCFAVFKTSSFIASREIMRLQLTLSHFQVKWSSILLGINGKEDIQINICKTDPWVLFRIRPSSQESSNGFLISPVSAPNISTVILWSCKWTGEWCSRGMAVIVQSCRGAIIW